MPDQDRIRAFVVDALQAMNYDVSDVTGATVLGPAGIDLDSLALADLAVQVEEEYGIKYDIDDMEHTALFTMDEFAGDVIVRMRATAAAGGAQ